ncbi:hypothetical protein PIB30_026284, partial [Stylosanthes scabra]|nr:hypothetical protein [Stylosanthes scabra]
MDMCMNSKNGNYIVVSNGNLSSGTSRVWHDTFGEGSYGKTRVTSRIASCDPASLPYVVSAPLPYLESSGWDSHPVLFTCFSDYRFTFLEDRRSIKHGMFIDRFSAASVF